MLGDLMARRGTIEGLESRGNARVVRALVPLSRLFGYTTVLRSMTQGRPQSTMALARYSAVPSAFAGGIAQATRA